MPDKTATQDYLEIVRVFNAPIEKLWQAWSDPETLKKWWGPKIFSAPTVQVDFREGGKYLLSMQSDEWMDGREMFSAGTYQEIEPMKKIVMSDHFADDKGNVVPASYYDMPGELPLEMTIVLTFEDLGGGQTKLTLRHEGMPAGEQQTGATEGWNESLDKLDHVLTAEG